MALSTQHVKPAKFDNFVVLGRDGCFRRRTCLRPLLLVLVGSLSRRQAESFKFLVGDEVDIAAEHDVGAATRHVGRDGHRTLTPSLRND